MNNNKYDAISATVVNKKGAVDIYNNHVVIPLNTVENDMNAWKTIYEFIDRNYFR